MAEVTCKTHPDAPHGFDRNASHNADRYVCECESWEPKPVAHVYRIEPNGRPCVAWDNASEIKVGAKLYAAPPKRDLTCVCGAVWEGEQMVHAPRKREWVGLTGDDIHDAFCHAEYDASQDWNDDPEGWCKAFANYVEAKLKEKNQ